MALSDGRLVDSARLPQSSVRGQPVTYSAESLMHSLQTTESAHAHPITLSGASNAASQQSARQGRSAEGHPVMLSGGSIMDSAPGTARRQQDGAIQQDVEYHPVVVTDPDHLSEEALQGSISLLYYP